MDQNLENPLLSRFLRECVDTPMHCNFTGGRYSLSADHPQGVQFNILLAGGKALGKTSFIHTFLRLKLAQELGQVQPTQAPRMISAQLPQLWLNFIDTPGFDSFDSVAEYWDLLFHCLLKQTMLHQETKACPDFSSSEDSRVHLCLFFLSGPRVKRPELRLMQQLQEFVTLLPVLAKADGYTPVELSHAKHLLLQECTEACIQFAEVKPLLPLAVATAASSPREYVWGVCEVTDPRVCDFAVLSDLLLNELVLQCRRRVKKSAARLLQAHKRRLEELEQSCSVELPQRLWLQTVSSLLLSFLKY